MFVYMAEPIESFSNLKRCRVESWQRAPYKRTRCVMVMTLQAVNIPFDRARQFILHFHSLKNVTRSRQKQLFWNNLSVCPISAHNARSYIWMPGPFSTRHNTGDVHSGVRETTLVANFITSGFSLSWLIVVTLSDSNTILHMPSNTWPCYKHIHGGKNQTTVNL